MNVHGHGPVWDTGWLVITAIQSFSQPTLVNIGPLRRPVRTPPVASTFLVLSLQTCSCLPKAGAAVTPSASSVSFKTPPCPPVRTITAKRTTRIKELQAAFQPPAFISSNTFAASLDSKPTRSASRRTSSRCGRGFSFTEVVW